MRDKLPLVELKALRTSETSTDSTLISRRYFRHHKDYYELVKRTNGKTTFEFWTFPAPHQTFNPFRGDIGSPKSWADAERASMIKVDASCISREDSTDDEFVKVKMTPSQA